MSDLDRIISVSINLRSLSLTRKSFGIPMIAGFHNKFAPRAKAYTKLSELLADGFSEDSAIYRAAQALLSPSPTVASFLVGRLAGTPVAMFVTCTPVAALGAHYEVALNGTRFSTQIWIVTPTTVTNSATYTITVNGTVYSITADSSTSATEICDAFRTALAAEASVVASGTATLILTAVSDQDRIAVITADTKITITSGSATQLSTALTTAINAGTEPVTAAVVSATFTLTGDVVGENFGLLHNENITSQDTTANAAIATEIAAIQTENDTWYPLGLLGTGKAEILAAAAYIETQEKIMIAVTEDSDVVTNVTTDVVSAGKALERNRSAVMYSGDGGAYPNIAAIGRVMSKDPGKVSWAYKTLPGVVPNSLTSDQITNLLAKNAMFYTTISGKNVTQNGKMLSGRYIDIQVGLDFVKARIQEQGFALVSSVDKVPYTPEGCEMIAGSVRLALKAAQDNQIVAEGSWSVTVPDFEDIPAEDKEDRVLNNVLWSAQLVGAIETVGVEGDVFF